MRVSSLRPPSQRDQEIWHSPGVLVAVIGKPQVREYPEKGIGVRNVVLTLEGWNYSDASVSEQDAIVAEAESACVSAFVLLARFTSSLHYFIQLDLYLRVPSPQAISCIMTKQPHPLACSNRASKSTCSSTGGAI
jgi:hypothetical protein